MDLYCLDFDAWVGGGFVYGLIKFVTLCILVGKEYLFLLFLCFECRKIGLDCGFVEFLGNN